MKRATPDNDAQNNTTASLGEAIKKFKPSTGDVQHVYSTSQKEALKLIMEGQNVLLTGEAGSGKSFTLHEARRQLQETGKVAQFCATTGSAAWQIFGTTLHAWSGCGIGNQGDAAYYAKKIKSSARKDDWLKLDVLFIEECSMLDVAFFTLLDEVARKVRQSVYAFGGIQIVLIGDFLQCPPIPPKGQERKYVFECDVWKKLHINYVVLRSNFRQQTDTRYRELLQRMKLGELTEEDTALLKSRVVAQNHDCSQMTRLRSRRAAVERINNEEIGKLEGETVSYEAVLLTYDNVNRATRQQIDAKEEDKAPVDRKINLRVGTLVLLCCNMDITVGLFNGARGEVIGFKQQRGAKPNAPRYPIVKFECGEIILVTPHQWDKYIGRRLVSSFQQVPLIPRYAITIHKAQGLTLLQAQFDNDVFDSGQEYVACSRVPSLDALFLTRLNTKTIMPDQKVVDFLRDNNLL
jgi:ATP-dependent DNA helicase PIF1